MSSIRPAAVAGMFYPRDAAVLRGQVRSQLAGAADPGAGARPKMLVLPHAGHVYSGPVAASGYRLLGRAGAPVRRVVLVGPAHRVALHGIAAPRADAFETPLGRVPVDQAALAAVPGLRFDDRPHAEEHALEVHLPFLQVALDQPFVLLPLVVGRCPPDELAAALDALWGGDETLVIVSSDLSHYLGHADAVAADRMTVRRIAALATDIDPHEACGAHALNGALLLARRRGLVGRLVDLRNSGDTAGSRDRVVGYAALAFDDPAAATRAPGDAAATAPTSTNDEDDDARRLGAALIARARNAIAATLGAPLRPEPAHPALARPACTFVTLREPDGALRGCIGGLLAERKLDDDVRRHARAAAFDDPRFTPLSAAEWPALSVEVSLLEPPSPLPAASREEAMERLVPGVDGVIVECEGRRATFLPQVWEQLPEPDTFLSALLRKAGLPPAGWPAGIRLQRYRVRRFDEPRDDPHGIR